MADFLRDIDSPGVSIREFDLSQYGQVQVGTYVLIPGYFDSGEDFKPTTITNLNEKIALYGTPKNEAESYAHYAIEEVLNNGGIPVVAKIPYDSLQSKNYRAYGISVGTPDTLSLSASGTFSKAISGAVQFYSQYAPISFSHISIANELYNDLKDGSVFKGIAENYDFILVDKTKSVNKKPSGIQGEVEKEGLVAVLVDPVDAIMVQMLADGASDDDVAEVITKITGISDTELDVKLSDSLRWSSLSEDLAKRFPTIPFNSDGTDIKKDYSNYIGLIVLRTYYDPQGSEKIRVSVLESFVGSVHKSEINKSTGKSAFIGDIINENSVYFEFFAKPQNYDYSNNKNYNPISSPALASVNKDVILINDQSEYDLFGFSEIDAAKVIDGRKIVGYLKTIINRTSNIDDLSIDVVVDAGLSTIAQATSSVDGYTDLSNIILINGFVYDGTNMVWDYDSTPVVSGDASSSNWGGIEYIPSLYNKEITSTNDVSYWRDVVNTLVDFCENVRKDCMAIIDLPRNLVLAQNEKILSDNKPDNTFTGKITSKLKYVQGPDSSYYAKYVTWYSRTNSYLGKKIWLPQTIAMAGIYCKVDTQYQIWNDPAGLTRGRVINATDIAINPDQKQTDILYRRSINYLKSYRNDGIVAMGQKTGLAKPSTFDRVNVRRLFLKLERFVYKNVRYFVHEPNNLFTRRRVVDVLDPEFKSIKNQGGLYNYDIICDERNNTPDVINNNELRIAIIVDPTRSGEFVLVSFYGVKHSVNFEETVTEIIGTF